MNDFYTQPRILQWTEAIVFMFIGFLPALFIISNGNATPLYYSLFIVYVPIAQFAFTPFFKLSGVYTYYSPMLLGYMPNGKEIDLHSGTSFDYLFVLRGKKAGIQLRNQLLIYHLEGLLKIIELIEQNHIPQKINIVGTSYFFNERTIKKIGFEQVNPSFFYRLNLYFNYIDIFWMYALSQGKLTIPKIWNAKKAIVSGAKLLENKDRIEDLHRKMTRTSI